MIRIVCYIRKSDGRVLVRSPHGYIYIAATPTLPTIYNSGHHGMAVKDDKTVSVYDGVNKGDLEQADLVDMKWLHPHLIKSIKRQVKLYLKNSYECRTRSKR